MILAELHEHDAARRFVLQGFCRQSVLPPSNETAKAVLEWGLEIVAAGDPLPPLGVVADLGHLAFGTTLSAPHPSPPVPGWPAALTRAYEDAVLGKLYVDSSFERGAAGLVRYQGRDRARGLAFLVNAFRERAGFGGALLSPAVIKALLLRPEEVLSLAWNTFDPNGMLPLIPRMYEEINLSVRNMAASLAPEDVFELEHRTALMPFGDRLALRQVLQAAETLSAELPARPRRAGSRVRPVATQLLDEDIYPVGGFSSISNRGSIESLLHSQLAYMEDDERPDLFDIKYLRDELLFYSRDENQFLRRRRQFVFVLSPDLVQARVKDHALPWQRIILLQAVLVTAVRQLTAWLGEEALVFRLVFPAGDQDALPSEQSLLGLLFREAIANGTVVIETRSTEEIAPLCQRLARTALTHAIGLTVNGPELVIEGVTSQTLRVRSRPTLEGGENHVDEPATAMEAWQRVTPRLLEACV